MKWCEIFKTGEHTDSKGNKKIWTFDDLMKIKNNFKNKNNEVPVCCGHPKSNSPAYGWIDDLKIAGNSLYASYKGVQKEFKEAVNKGLFKTRSISLTPDLVLRHVAFLGGQTPAIKGLEKFCFSDCEDEIIINFEEMKEEPMSCNQEPTAEGGALPSALSNIKGEKDVETEQLKSELSKKDKRIAELEAQLKKHEKEKLLKEFQEFCDGAVAAGHILPSQKDDVISILEACNAYEAFEFSDGESKTAVKMFKDFVSGLKQFSFEEIADKNKVKQSGNAIDFEDVNSITNGIIEIQQEYKKKGIELSSEKALKILKNKE